MRKYFQLLIILVLAGCSASEPDLEDYFLSDQGLELQLVASEPDIVAPVAIDFDKQGRMWVAEMPDYMPDINGEGEATPSSRIVIMEDVDGDGKMEEAKVFLDGIHHLRAIRLFRNGILYADDPNLYFAEIENDRPVRTIIIDSTYSSGGNIEHKPNGLLRALDNCFYSAKSHYRYCYDEGEWNKEAVFFRGQWGITQDKNGRLYSNDNSNFLYGDRFLPSLLTHNKYIHKLSSINSDLVGSRSVYPLQPTAINRGYNEGMLSADGILLNTSSACGPHIYNGAAMGDEYMGDAFVCVPEGNLIKQLKLSQGAFQQDAKFAYDSSEFLVSKDLAFRPVNIETGPDGAMYIVDFHRGIIQHKIYMTNYLREKIEADGLDEIMNYGRVLRVVQKGSSYERPDYQFQDVDSLISYLDYNNSWLQGVAQEELVYSKHRNVDEKLMSSLINGSSKSIIRKLWVMGVRGNIDLNKILTKNLQDPWVVANLFKIVAENNKEIPGNEIRDLFLHYRGSDNEVVRNHLVASLHILHPLDKDLHQELWQEMDDVLLGARLSAYPSGVVLDGEGFAEYNERIAADDVYYIHKERDVSKMDVGGYELYNKYCSSCHGYGGMGVQGQAPSLVGAELVNAGSEVVPLIIMHGLEGSVTVNSAEEKYGAVMPAFAESANMTSQDIAGISNYIYNAFRGEVLSISSAKVDSLQAAHRGRKEMWTERELLRTD